MTTDHRTPILLGTMLALLICLAVGCRNIGRKGPEIDGYQLTLLSSNYEVSVPDTIDTIAIADQELFHGKEFKLHVHSPDVLVIARGPTQRFQDQMNDMVIPLLGRNGVITSTVPLRQFPAAPCQGALLKNPGTYNLRFFITPTDSLWEIDKID